MSMYKYKLLRGCHSEGGTFYRKGDIFNSPNGGLTKHNDRRDPKFAKLETVQGEEVDEDEVVEDEEVNEEEEQENQEEQEQEQEGEKTKAELRAELKAQTVEQLLDFCITNEIQLEAGVTRKNDIIKSILEHYYG